MPEADAPWLWLIAGPNGSGKSTLAKEFMPDIAGTGVFLNADDEARLIDENNPARAAMSAGRRILQQITKLIEAEKSFAIETTLAGLSYVRKLEIARDAGFKIGLIYVWIGVPELAIQRVGERVRRGGHFVPPEDITRRFTRGLRNFPTYLDLVDQAAIYDNVGASPFIVAKYDGVVWSADHERKLDEFMRAMDEAK